MKLLVDEDLVSVSLLQHLQEAGHEVVQCPTGTPDETVFVEAQRLGLPLLTANVGRKGRRDPVGYTGSPWSESFTMVSSGFFVPTRLVGSLIRRLSKRSAVLPTRNRHSPVRHYGKILLRG